MNERAIADADRSARFEAVILPCDGSRESLAALPTARALCRRFGARLVVTSVAADAEGARSLGEHAEEALGDTAQRHTVEVIVDDDPARVIVERTARWAPAVVCMSTRGRGRVSGSLVGSVARAVIRTSPTPVVVVGPQADRPGWLVGRSRRRPAAWPEPFATGGIAACVDGSPDSELVLPEAARWAAALDMPLSIVTVAEDVPPDVGGRSNRFGPAEPQRYVDDLADGWRAAGSDVVGVVVLDPIGVASGLRWHLAANDVGLVALASHARSGLDRLRFGATSADIVASSTVPVLVVPVGGDAVL